jgi:hypothetical protein
MRLMMNGFLSAMFDEIAKRRRRQRSIFGDRGQAIVEFLVMSGLVLGSVGLLLEPHMARVAPWGFALPPIFLIGFVLLEARRQRAAAAPKPDAEADKGAAEDAVEAADSRSDWTVFLWSFGCALAGGAAFVIAWGARPAPPPEVWQPPPGTVDSDIGRPN